MTDETKPDIAFHGLSIWVLGRTFPDSDHSWDGNMLTVRLRMETHGSVVDVTERDVHISVVGRFVNDLAALNDTLRGTAKLNPLEPSFDLEFVGNGKGHIDVTVDLTPNHMTERHKFMLSIDQTYLGPILSRVRSILDRYPERR
jgi:hypothetical protein